MSRSINVQFPAGKPVPVSVNSVVIAPADIVREMQHHPAARPDEAWRQAARALVVRELLLQRARHLGIESEPTADIDGRRETEEEAVIRALVAREVAVPEPDDAACRRYYTHNVTRFRSPDIYEASHILLAADPTDAPAREQARAEAEAVLVTLRADPDAFAMLARAHSRCPSATQGGNLGQITEGQTTPEFERALMALAPGETCAEPVATRYGFHIVRLDRRHDGRVLPYEAVAERIADYLRERVRRTAAAQYVARLVSGATITGVTLPGAEAHRVH